MTIVTKRVFRYETIIIDSHTFVDCEFIGCTFLFGGGDYGFYDCVHNKCVYHFFGPALRAQQLILAHELDLLIGGREAVAQSAALVN